MLRAKQLKRIKHKKLMSVLNQMGWYPMTWFVFIYYILFSICNNPTIRNAAYKLGYVHVLRGVHVSLNSFEASMMWYSTGRPWVCPSIHITIADVEVIEAVSTRTPAGGPGGPTITNINMFLYTAKLVYHSVR